jgi:hypothetical protein
MNCLTQGSSNICIFQNLCASAPSHVYPSVRITKFRKDMLSHFPWHKEAAHSSETLGCSSQPTKPTAGSKSFRLPTKLRNVAHSILLVPEVLKQEAVLNTGKPTYRPNHMAPHPPPFPKIKTEAEGSFRHFTPIKFHIVISWVFLAKIERSKFLQNADKLSPAVLTKTRHTLWSFLL